MDSRRNFLRGLAQAAAGAGRSDSASPDPSAQDAQRSRSPEGAGDPPPDRPTSPRSRYADAVEDPDWGPEGQRAVAAAAVIVLGASGLASPVAAYLAGAGVGRLGIVDGEDVELAELHSQTLHYTPDVGVPRAHSAAAKLAFLNPEIVVEPYQATVGAENAEAVVAGGHDLVVDCTDEPALRQLVNATCCAAGVPLITAEVHRRRATLWFVRPGVSACLECAEVGFDPATPGPSSGGAGPVLGVVGSLQAALALDVLRGRAPSPPETGLAIDLDRPDLRRLAATRRADCPVCGDRPQTAMN